nr:synaptobrevin, longin-like domain protein [Tanacetum cinerariifolium]
MVALRYRDEHNKVGYLLKPTGSDDYHYIIDFLRASHIRSPELSPPAIQATIDKTPYTIIEDLVRSQLQLADDGGIDDLPIAKIYSGTNNLGYVTEGKLTFFKNKFSPQWRFLVHTILHCLSTKSDSWDQFGSPIAVALIYEPLEGSFHMSPQRSTQAPPAGQPSGGVKDPITLTALSFVVSTLVYKVKLKTKKRKMVVSDSDQEDGGKQDVHLDALRSLANVAVNVDSNIPPGGASHIFAASTSVPAIVPTGASTVPAGILSVLVDVPPSVAPADVSNKGKSPMVKEDIPVKARTFKQMQADILGEQLPSQNGCFNQRKKQALAEKLAKEMRNRPMTQAQQRTYMRQFVKNQSRAVYSTGWSMARVKSFTDAQLKEEFENIQKAISNIQIQAFRQTLKRPGPVLEEHSSKRQKSTEAPIPSVPDVPQSPVFSSPPSFGTRRKSLGRKRLPKPKSTLQELDLDADAQTFIKIVSTEDSDDTAPLVWSALVGWEVTPTPLGEINALYRMDRSTLYFTTLIEILHMVDRQDLLKLYRLVVKYYENHPVAGVGLIL